MLLDLTEETHYVADDLVDVIIKYCDNILRIFGFANPYLPFMFWLKSKAIDIKDRKSIFYYGVRIVTLQGCYLSGNMEIFPDLIGQPPKVPLRNLKKFWSYNNSSFFVIIFMVTPTL
jgi:uncharacterized membrane protein